MLFFVKRGQWKYIQPPGSKSNENYISNLHKSSMPSNYQSKMRVLRVIINQNWQYFNSGWFRWNGPYVFKHGEKTLVATKPKTDFDGPGVTLSYFTEIWELSVLLRSSSHTLKRACRHFDKIYIYGCTGKCHYNNFHCSQWRKFRQNDKISVSVYACQYFR